MKISKLVAMSLVCLGLVGVSTSCYSMEMAKPQENQSNDQHANAQPYVKISLDHDDFENGNIGRVKTFTILPIDEISVKLQKVAKLNKSKIDENELADINKFKMLLVDLFKKAVVSNKEEERDAVGKYLMLHCLMNIAVDKFSDEINGIEVIDEKVKDENVDETIAGSYNETEIKEDTNEIKENIDKNKINEEPETIEENIDKNEIKDEDAK